MSASFKPSLSAVPRGVALIEAMVALLILAIGVLELAALQGRMLTDTRTTNARAVAVQLIGDLAERIRLNAQGAQPAGVAPSLSPYSDTTAAAFPAAPATLPLDCASEVCTVIQRASYDTGIWRQHLAAVLMNGRASIWQVGPRQLQVVVAWQANENASDVLGSAANTRVADPLQILAAAAGTTCNANSGYLCHIDFIDIPPAQ